MVVFVMVNEQRQNYKVVRYFIRKIDAFLKFVGKVHPALVVNQLSSKKTEGCFGRLIWVFIAYYVPHTAL